MKYCDECNKKQYEEQLQAQKASMDKPPYYQAYLRPEIDQAQFSANSNCIPRSVNCSICEKELACTDRDFKIVLHFKNRDSEPQTIRFKNVGSKCNDYLSIATANDIYELYEEVSKKLNPLSKDRKDDTKKKSLFKRIFK